MAAVTLALTAATPGRAAATESADCQGGPVYEAMVLDAETGQVLRQVNPDVLTYPASLTKMMTLYLTFEALNQGRLRLNQMLPVSVDAANHSPSKLGLTPGEAISVRDLVLGLVTRSANDAAAVLAEGLAGSEAAFAQRMTWKARQLGMLQTTYRNASGLPDPEQRTTARDIARLALALLHQFPREYRYFATQEFVFRGEVVRTHNHLMEWYPGVDGIKTGYVRASGFNLATSAVRGGRRLIGVIMGGQSAHGRDVQMAALLDQGFSDLETNPLVASRQLPVVAVAAAPAAAAPVAALVAAAPAVAAPAAAAPPAATTVVRPAVVASAATPAAARLVASAPTASPEEKTAFISTMARNALRHLSPVAKAEAAPLAREAPAPAEEWSIQLGAFRGETAAQQAARKAAAVPVLRGKRQQIVAPARGEAARLYRVRVLHFTSKEAQAACAELRRRGVACTLVRPVSTRVANT